MLSDEQWGVLKLHIPAPSKRPVFNAGIQNPQVQVLLVFMHKMMLRSQSTSEDPGRLPNDPDTCRRSGGNLTPFFQRDAASGATLLATGVSDSPADSLLQVEVTAAGSELTVLILWTQDFLPLAEYTLEYREQP